MSVDCSLTPSLSHVRRCVDGPSTRKRGTEATHERVQNGEILGERPEGGREQEDSRTGERLRVMSYFVNP